MTNTVLYEWQLSCAHATLRFSRTCINIKNKNLTNVGLCHVLLWFLLCLLL